MFGDGEIPAKGVKNEGERGALPGGRGLPAHPQVDQFLSHGRLWHEAAGLPADQMVEQQA